LGISPRFLVVSARVPVRLGTPRGDTLKLNGVGFKVFGWKESLVFQLGYSHYVGLLTPSGVLTRARRGSLTVPPVGPSGNLAARVIDLRRPDPYKARGIYSYSNGKPVTKPGKRR